VIGALRGQLAARLADGTTIVDVHGVGYRVSLSGRGSAAVSIGSEVELAVHTHVRDDAIVLYAFLTPRERDCFEALVAAPGVGPALAQSILSTLGPDALSAALAADDVDALVAVPGVGRKTAARLLLELRGHLLATEAVADEEGAPTVRVEVRGALSELGYTSEEVRRAVEQLDDTESVEDALRQALRVLSRR
jgi:holliday junction DNA helicase RuvA